MEVEIEGRKNILIGYKVMYYHKFHCELSHIQYFWCDGKSWAQRHYKYILEELKENISQTLNQIKSFTILEHCKNCLKKIELYWKIYNIGQGSRKELCLIIKLGV